jgi:hypothetical protein
MRTALSTGLWSRTSQEGVLGRKAALRYVVVGEIAFLFFLGICVALHPGFVLKRDEGGMSNYGLHAKTALPYTLALASLSFCSIRAALSYSGYGSTRTPRLVTLGYGVIVAAVLLSTYAYSANAVLTDIHFGLGAVLVGFTGVSALWMSTQGKTSVWVVVLLGVQLCGDAGALLATAGALHALFAAEMATNLGFSALLIRTCQRVATL